jgi:hypothetical protein
MGLVVKLTDHAQQMLPVPAGGSPVYKKCPVNFRYIDGQGNVFGRIGAQTAAVLVPVIVFLVKLEPYAPVTIYFLIVQAFVVLGRYQPGDKQDEYTGTSENSLPSFQLFHCTNDKRFLS